MPANSGYKIFISYRRGMSAPQAQGIREALLQQGWLAFLDADLRAGYFDEALLNHIAEAPNFLVILTQGSLDRCSHKDDWLRQEISFAMKTQRNIIPVVMPGFVYPCDLPEEINDLPRYQYCDYPPLQYYQAMIDRIIDNLVHEETQVARSARERTMLELRQATQAEKERKSRERAEEERRKLAREQAERLALERQEAERRERLQNEQLTPEARKARALFKGRKIINSHQGQQRPRLILLWFAGVIGLSIVGFVSFKEQLREIGLILEKHKFFL